MGPSISRPGACRPSASGSTPSAVTSEALRRKPDFAFAWQELCRLQFQTGDPRQALQSARNGLRAAPDSAMLQFYLGNLLFEQGEHREAAAAYRRALQAAPDLAQAHANLGQAQAVASR